jgi:UDP-N-acetylmuramyl pentapeptide phosphotransferase/UDP-N-acetylglucosamine-1-phosphate transferase
VTAIAATCSVTFLTALILTPLVRSASRRIGYVDVPNERSSHDTPTPRTGGYAIVAGVLAGAAMAGALHDRGLAATAGGMVLLVVLAVIDDFHSLPNVWRLLAQFAIAAAALLVSGEALHELALPSMTIPLGGFALAASLVWIVAVTNEYNFMDGLNGIASGEAIIAAATMAILFWRAGDIAGAAFAAALGAAAAGFLPWNLPSGSIFMGDSGSTPLGFSFAMLTLRLTHQVPFIAAMLPLTPFLFDATFTLFRRALRRERVFSAHRKHLYQLLNRRGWSHAAVTLVWTLLAAACGALALTYPGATEGRRLAICAAVLIAHSLLAWTVIRSTPAAAR